MGVHEKLLNDRERELHASIRMCAKAKTGPQVPCPIRSSLKLVAAVPGELTEIDFRK